jgi:orotate phosphoribosyltransferase
MTLPTKTVREIGLTMVQVIILVDREEGGRQTVTELVL